MKRSMSVFLWLLAAIAPAHAELKSEVDAMFDEAFTRYALPGLAVGVIVDGEVAYMRTAGELRAGEGEKITPETLFKIASNSKAMTAAVLARLVDQGKLAWTDPVVKHLPQFRMHDDWVTREMQVRDLLIHNSGLGAGAGDLMLWPEPNLFTRGDVIRGLRHLRPAYSFRSRYAYDNTLYIVAGEVAAAAGGAPFDQLVRRELFEPLGMARCQAGQWRRDAVGNVAQPHMRQPDGTQVVVRADGEMIPDVPMMAAGGIRCSLDDMLRWAAVWLQPTRHGLDAAGTPWLSDTQRGEAWKNHMPMPLSQRMRDWDSSHYSAYGYGWRLADVDGTWKVSHTGTLSGMYSALTLLPHKGVGMVILANGNADELRTVLGQVLVKRFTQPQDATLTVAHYAGLLAAARAASQEAPPDAAASIVADRAPATVSDPLLMPGRYVDPWFGEVLVCAAGEGVEFRALKSPKLRGAVLRSHERLLVDWHDPDVDVEAWLTFDAAGAATRMTMAKLDPAADFSYDYEDLAFQRTGDCPAHQPGTAARAPPTAASQALAATPESVGMVDIGQLVPGIDLDIRYAGPHNFTGRPVEGYDAPKCYLLRPAAEALRDVELELRREGLRLRIFDCYRPARAVRQFVRWAADANDQSTKAEYYPALDKSTLVPGYIADQSGHSKGATVDLTLLRCGEGGCRPLDMGTAFDFFDPVANTDHPGIEPGQRDSRARLRDTMARHGFENYPMEWWHYTFRMEPPPEAYHDVPIR